MRVEKEILVNMAEARQQAADYSLHLQIYYHIWLFTHQFWPFVLLKN
jgi:hypothetical protein